MDLAYRQPKINLLRFERLSLCDRNASVALSMKKIHLKDGMVKLYSSRETSFRTAAPAQNSQFDVKLSKLTVCLFFHPDVEKRHPTVDLAGDAILFVLRVEATVKHRIR